jgi:biopolymer transport protein ExbB
MWDFFVNGGPVMYVLLLCSISGLTIIIQKVLFLRSQELDNKTVANYAKDQLTTNGKETTYRVLLTKRKLVLNLLSNAIKLSHLPNEEIELSIKRISTREIPKIEKNMNMLSSIITIAPTLGLFGTVLGLMEIFNVMSGGNIGNPELLSKGIAEALITTVSGLGISIPFLVAYQYLNHRLEIFSTNLEQLLEEIISFCKQTDLKP